SSRSWSARRSPSRRCRSYAAGWWRTAAACRAPTAARRQSASRAPCASSTCSTSAATPAAWRAARACRRTRRRRCWRGWSGATGCAPSCTPTATSTTRASPARWPRCSGPPRWPSCRERWRRRAWPEARRAGGRERSARRLAGAAAARRVDRERHLDVDAVVRDLAVLDDGLEVLDVDRLDAADGTGRLLQRLLGRVLPALLRLRQ